MFNFMIPLSVTTNASSLLADSVKSVTITDMLTALISGVVMGFFISLVYIFTHRKSGYSQSYVMTLLVLPPIVAIVLVMINSMASALCRYRTIPGDPKDITYVFFAMAVGVICGINSLSDIWFVFVFFAVIAAVLILVELCNFGKCKTTSMTLKITIPENLNYVGLFDDLLNVNATEWTLKRVKTTNFGSLFDLVYSVQLKQNIDQKAFIDEVRKLNGNLTVVLSLYRFDDKIYEK